jgi:hypothetical protein
MNANRTVEELQSSWGLLFPGVQAPDARTWALWITEFGTDTVRRCITKLAQRYRKSSGDFASGESLYKFATVLMGRINREPEQTGNSKQHAAPAPPSKGGQHPQETDEL